MASNQVSGNFSDDGELNLNAALAMEATDTAQYLETGDALTEGHTSMNQPAKRQSRGVKGRIHTARPVEVFDVEPDPGADNSSLQAIARLLLAQWGRWTKGQYGAMGYPTRSVSEKANEGGITAGSPRPPIELPEDVMRTDRAVSVLRLRHRSKLCRVIELVYQKGLHPKLVAKELHMNPAPTRRLIERAERAVYYIREAL